MYDNYKNIENKKDIPFWVNDTFPLPITLEEFKIKLRKIHPHIEVLSDSYKNNKTNVHLRCELDGFEWWARGDNLLRYGCKRCSGTERYTLNTLKEKISKISPNIEILSTEYKNTHSKIYVKCKNCDREWLVKPYKLLQYRNCARCKWRNEKEVGICLKKYSGYMPPKHKIREEIFDKLGNKIKSSIECDFYFEYKNKKYIIEYNGLQHYKIVNFGNGQEKAEENFKIQLIRDEWLRIYCHKNNISLIEIDGREFYDEKISLFINELFKKL